MMTTTTTTMTMMILTTQTTDGDGDGDILPLHTFSLIKQGLQPYMQMSVSAVE